MSNRCFSLTLVFVLSLLQGLCAQGVFASGGEWFGIEVHGTQSYQITYQDLKNWGMDMNSDPRNFHVFGYMGSELASRNEGALTVDPPELSIAVVGESDGKWDPGDYVEFFVLGPKGHALNKQQSAVPYTRFYDAKLHFVAGHNSERGLRMLTQSAWVGSEPMSQWFHWASEFVWHDSDRVNPTAMGRTWLGEKLGNETLTRSWKENLGTRCDSAALSLTLAPSLVDQGGSVKIQINDTQQTLTLRPISNGFEAHYLLSKSYRVPLKSGQLDLTLDLNRPNTQSSLYLESYSIELFGEALTPDQNTLLFNEGLAQYPSNTTRGWRLVDNLQTTPLPRYWNVTNPYQPFNLQNPQVSKNGKAWKELRFFPGEEAGMLWVSYPNQLAKPVFTGRFTVNNVTGEFASDMIILTHSDFLEAATKLALHRIQKQGYSVKVVLLDDIYKEFGAGQPDLMHIRNYARLELSKAKAQNVDFRYLLIMGSASYDMQDRVSHNTNFVPIYHANTNNKAAAFCLDDFIAYTDSGQGDPEKGVSRMAFAVGRIPCRTADDAKAVVEKLIRYDDKKSLGDWRSQITFVCDDMDEYWEREFVTQTESYAQSMVNSWPYLNVNRVYADAYKQVTTGNGEKYPDVSKAIDRAVQEGSLFVNYQGHGGEKGWAQEAFLDVPMIQAWKNPYRMPVLFTATCEFSRFDDPEHQSAGELALLNPSGGAVGLMSTTRLVYVSGNSEINRDFWTKYGFPKVGEPVPTLGEVFQRMKNRPSLNSEDNKFALLGDPSMRLAFPEHLIIIDSINDIPEVIFDDTIRAFSVVKVKGHISERQKGYFKGFNGVCSIKVFDKPINRSTLNNDGSSDPVDFQDWASILFNGEVSVVDGAFSFVFAVPKDINYNIGLGRAQFYAHNGETDAMGAWSFLIGGSEAITELDTSGPEVRAYLEDTTFVAGAVVPATSTFVGRVFDRNGINATGAGIGRDMLLILDEGTEREQQWVVNDYFTYDLNSYQRGTISFPLPTLAPGKHTIRCKVWDIYNNSGEGKTNFVVSPGRELVISRHGMVPNPAHAGSRISVTHSLPGDDLQVTWQWLDMAGRVVRQETTQESSSLTTLSWSPWGRNSAQGPDPLPQGMYLYRVLISTLDGLSAVCGGKFVWTGQ